MDELSALKTKAEQGDAEAQYALGKFYLDKYETSYTDEDEETAQRWFELAAEQGHREAQYCLGRMICDFGNVYPSISSKWYRAAAEQGHPEACMELVDYELEYDGTESGAVKWYRRARELGHPHDGMALNIYYQVPDFSPYTWDETLSSLRQFAEAGDTQAQLNLARVYADEESNFIQAYAWCAVSARHVPGTALEEVNEQLRTTSSLTARSILRLLEQVLSEDELEKAHRLASEYLENFGQVQVRRLQILGWREFLYGVWTWKVLWLALAPILILLLLWYLLVAVLASAVVLPFLGILGPRIALGAVVLIIGLALWMRHLSRREEREAWKLLRKCLIRFGLDGKTCCCG